MSLAKTKAKLTFLSGTPQTGVIQLRTAERDIGGLEVLVSVTHCGVCATDAHDRADGCGLGHEGVGVVVQVGESVSSVSVGARVGWGWQHTACLKCRECVTGYRQYCPQSLGQKFGEREQGAFGDLVIKHQDFLNLIPEGIESKHAAPLQCAGAAVFEALHAADTKSTDRVGVVGLGGLGHMAVQFAKAMGCEVVVFSRNEVKKEDAMALGAKEFVVVPSQGPIEGVEGVNVLLCCGELPNFDQYFLALARRATIVPLVIQVEKPVQIAYLPFILPGHRIMASTEACKKNHSDVLTFAAKHGIKPWIEEFPMSTQGLSDALDRLEKGEIRYRAVLSTELGTIFGS
ncbi:NADP-dependent alcohol dehydrogenase [Coleophoma cylindrospora]|uniref:NADP-dependent alcohol dehydrogenase n=1 Tax=Coleophoma cylindrospora TaxID=1849047 RepID=A0A3D8S7X2_9HELO|nr:NADP-dependent alcohol dehydrogenase [Coleophoma cylindrospora]